MSDSPLVLLGFIAASAWVARQWILDYRAAREGVPSRSPLPGATPAPAAAIAVAALGSVSILAVETGGEELLGSSAVQSSMTALFALYSIAGAPVIEEVIFRGYLIIEGRGRVMLWAGAVAASLVFALLHPYLWNWTPGGLALRLDSKGGFSTAMIFALSLWLYAVRVFPLNPERSLLPCFAAHVTKNLGVFGVKYAQGFVHGWW